MCGIAGIISRIPLNTSHLVQMNQAMKHRGPDGEGYLLITDNEAFPLAGDDTPNDNRNLDYLFRLNNTYVKKMHISRLD